ncbi:MAG: putative Na+/H+ antiporter [Opitutales bacterium]
MPTTPDLWTQLTAAVRQDGFLLAASVVFGLAILHAFVAPIFARAAHKLEEAHREEVREGRVPVNDRGESSSLKAAIMHLLGEVEAVFGIWTFVLFGLLIAWPGKGWDFACRYVETGDYAAALAGVPPSGASKFIEPLFVFVIMTLAAARPVMALAARLLGGVAWLLGDGTAARWFVILTLAPLFGSLITEPAAMTIGALLLSSQFYALRPSDRLKYATLALLFVNISVGGALTNFAAPPIVMVAGKWGWSTADVFAHYGWAAVVSILASNLTYLLVFRKELADLKAEGKGGHAREAIPVWVTVVHLSLMVWTVTMLAGHRPILMLGGFLVFLAFTVATPQWQDPVRLRGPLLVGFFLAGLVVLGGLQAWWISPVIMKLNEGALMGVSTILTSFNDNAAITYLAAQVPALGLPGAEAEALRHAVVAGALAGGGLTVIANAPNPAGQSILSRHFGPGISPLRLALWALVPTAFALASFVTIR